MLISWSVRTGGTSNSILGYKKKLPSVYDLLFLPLLMTTVPLGSVSMSLSAFGNLDSPIPLCIVIFLNVQFCCSSLRVLINMFSSDGSCSAGISSYESDAEMCSCSVDSKEFFEPDLDPLPDSALAASDSDPDPLPDSASFASADSPEDRSKKSISTRVTQESHPAKTPAPHD